MTIARTILGFTTDEAGDWCVTLDCGHRRHIRHHPPLTNYAWVLDATEREARVGQSIECDRCRQREWPDGFEPYRATEVFDVNSVPNGLLADHRTRAGVWGRLEVLDGCVTLRFAAPLDHVVQVAAGESAAIPPELPHALELAGPVRLRVVFHRRSAGRDSRPEIAGPR